MQQQKLSLSSIRWSRKRKFRRKFTQTFRPPEKKYIVLKGKFFLFIAIFLFFTSGLVFLLRSSYFRIKEVRITGIPCLDESTSPACLKAYSYKKMPLATLSIDKVEEEIKSSDLQIMLVEGRKLYPSTVAFTITRRTPILAIPVSEPNVEGQESTREASSQAFFLIDKEGFITSREATSASYPIFWYHLKNGGRVFIEDEFLRSTLSLLSRLTERGIGISALSQKGNGGLQVMLDSGITVFFDVGKDHPLQVDSLQLILQNFTIEGKKYRFIDLRSEKPVTY